RKLNPRAASSGKLMAGRNVGDPGKGGQFRNDFSEEWNFAAARIPRFRQSNVEVDGLFEVEAGFEMKQVQHAPDEQARADQQSETQSGFSNYECVLQPISAAARRRRGGALAQRVRWIGAGYAPCREQPKEQRGSSGEQDGKQEHSHIDRDVKEAGNV